MNKFAFALALVCATLVRGDEVTERIVCDQTVEGDIYAYSAKPLNGSIFDTVSFSDYANSVVLFANVATYNERTTEKYTQLNELKNLFKNEAFEIFGYPSTQFNKEEPGATATEIYNGIKYARPGNGFEPAFTLFAKSQINGGEGSEEAIYTYLKGSCTYTSDTFNGNLEYSPLIVSDVRNPFEYFLVGKSGKVVYRYSATLSDTQTLVDDITALLAQ